MSLGAACPLLGRADAPHPSRTRRRRRTRTLNQRARTLGSYLPTAKCSHRTKIRLPRDCPPICPEQSTATQNEIQQKPDLNWQSLALSDAERFSPLTAITPSSSVQISKRSLLKGNAAIREP